MIEGRDDRRHGFITIGAFCLAVLLFGPGPATALAQQPAGSGPTEDPSILLQQAGRDLEEAKRLGARKYLPEGYQRLENALQEAQELLGAESVADHEKYRAVASVAEQAVVLRGRARFASEIRGRKSGLEGALDRFDQVLREIALSQGIGLEKGLSGVEAASALRDSLHLREGARRVLADSLRLANRRFSRSFEAVAAQRDSAVTALQVELENMRRQLWDAQLKAGIFEADLSAKEADLDRRRDREAAIERVASQFAAHEAEVLLTPEGEVIVRVFGFSFGVGSAALGDSAEPLLQKLVHAVTLFSPCRLKVEGHTDDTGSRQANLRLSEQRAGAVARQLAARLELDLAEIGTEGVGPDRPLALNSTREGRARNRRIEVVILGGEE